VRGLWYCVNRQTQPYRSNILVLHSALLHVSTIYISHPQVDIGSQKEREKRERSFMTESDAGESSPLLVVLVTDVYLTMAHVESRNM
jgi:hypothetical protein